MTSAQTLTRPWTVDIVHSNAEFAAKHMVISTVKGTFRDWEASITFDESNPGAASASASFNVASVDTGESNRDAHLRSDDFFNAEQYPRMTFESKRVEVVNPAHVRLIGDLTIRDVTKEVVLDTEYEGKIRDPYGNDRIAFTATAAINRKEFGLKWNGLLESGGMVVGDTIKITLNAQAIRPA